MNPDILIIGNCSIDQFMKIGEPHMIGEKICFIHGTKIPVKMFKTSTAGNACHVGIGTQKLGMNAMVYTELGDDENGKRFIDAFEKVGVNTKYCILNPNKDTNVHSIVVYGDDRTIFTYHGLVEYELDFEKLETPKWIYYTSLGQGFETFQKRLLKYLQDNPNIALAFNPGTFQLQNGLDSVKEILKHTDVLLVNKEEAQIIIHQMDGLEEAKNDYKKMHELLHKLGTKISLITDGSKGSSTYDGERYIYKEIIKLDGEFVDKTGAGDAYSAAFVAALHHKKSLETAMDWGNKNSMNTIKYVGGVEGLLDLETIE